MSNVNFGQNIDLHQNQILNVAIQVLASDPSTPVQGQIWFNSTSGAYKYYDGTSVQTLSSGTIVDASATVKGVSKLSVAPISSTNPIAVGDNDSRMTDSRNPTGSAGGDLSGTYPNPTVATVGAKTASQIATAVNEAHIQNTDTGTTQTSYQIDSGNNGPRSKNNAGVWEIRNAADSAYGDLRANNVYVNGELIEVSGSVVLVGDSYIRLNDQISTHAANSDAGVNIKRLASDNTTRVDAQIIYSESNGYFQAVVQDPSSDTSTLTFPVVRKYSQTIGDGSTTTFSIPHKLATTDIASVFVKKISTGELWEVGVKVIDANTISLTFGGTVPAINEFRVTVSG